MYVSYIWCQYALKYIPFCTILLLALPVLHPLLSITPPSIQSHAQAKQHCKPNYSRCLSNLTKPCNEQSTTNKVQRTNVLARNKSVQYDRTTVNQTLPTGVLPRFPPLAHRVVQNYLKLFFQIAPNANQQQIDTTKIHSFINHLLYKSFPPNKSILLTKPPTHQRLSQTIPIPNVHHVVALTFTPKHDASRRSVRTGLLKIKSDTT